MRGVTVCALVWGLAGCATVSMIPAETSVVAGLNANQTALRTASADFCNKLEDSGFVSKSSGLAGFAAMLMNGKGESSETSEGYVSAFEPPVETPGDRLAQLTEDAASVRIGLMAVIGEARTVLADTSTATQRADVTSFERALVKAQHASRTFSSAREKLSDQGTDTTPADRAISALDAEIDAVRRVADELAARYASISSSAA